MSRPATELLAFLLGLGVLIGGFIVHLGGLEADLANLTAEQREVEAAHALLRDQLGGADGQDFEALADGVVRRTEAIAELRARSDGPVAVLSALGQATPAEVWWRRVALSDDRLELKGASSEAEPVAYFLAAVQLLPCLEAVSLGSVQRTQLDGAPAQVFTLSARVLPPPVGSPHPCGGASIDRDPFASPGLVARRQAARHAPAILKWPLLDYRLVAVEYTAEGRVLGRVLDPDGGAHLLAEGSLLGAGKARVTQVLPDMLILTEEEVVDADTGTLRSRGYTLDLVEPTP